MNILRYILRKSHNCIFHLKCPNVTLDGKGIIKGVNCSNFGHNNVIHIEAGASLTNCTFFFKGNKNRLHISCGTHLKNVTFWFEDDNNAIVVGRSVTSEGTLSLAACESTSIRIGDDCMLSYGIQVRTTDSHSIVDADGCRINKSADILIGNHVWLGAEVMILKGSVVPDNCVVGARTMLTLSLHAEDGSLIAGMPAKVIRKDINWKREKL